MSEVLSNQKKRGRPRKVVEARKEPIANQIEEVRVSRPTPGSKFSGEAVKIKIYREDGQHDHADPWVPLSLGDLPTVWVLRGFDWIIPKEMLSVLQDTAVETIEMTPRRYPDANGNVYDSREVVKNRFPYQVMGEATWAEYEAFKAKLAKAGSTSNAS